MAGSGGSGGNIGNLEGKVVIDVADALTQLQKLNESLVTLERNLGRIAEARTVGPGVRNLDKLISAANAVRDLRGAAAAAGGGTPPPSATAAATGANATGSLTLTAESEQAIGEKIAAAIKTQLESEAITLKVRLNVEGVTGVEAELLKSLRPDGAAATEDESQGGNGVSDRQKYDLDRRQFRATNELTQTLRRVQAKSTGQNGAYSTMREAVKAVVGFVNGGELDAEIGKVTTGEVRIEGTNLDDQIADAVAKFLDLAPAVTRAGREIGTVPLGELSSFAGISDDFDEILRDYFRDRILVPIMQYAKNNRIDENLVYSTPMGSAGSRPEPADESPKTAPNGVRSTWDAKLEAITAAAAARRAAVEMPSAGATAAALGNLSDPTRIISKTSAEEEQAKLDALINANIENRPESYKTREQAFERVRGLMEFEGQIRPLDMVGGLKSLPYVGAPSSNVAEWERRRDTLTGTIGALEEAQPRTYTDASGRERTDLGVIDPSTGLKVTPGNRDRVLKMLRSQLADIGERPDEGPPMDEAAVKSELTRMGAGKGFRDAPLPVPALESLFQLINRGEFADVGFHEGTGTYFFPNNAAERMQLRRADYGHQVTMGDRGPVTRLKPDQFLREYVSQMVREQADREGEGSYDPTVRRLAAMPMEERELEVKTLVDRLMVGAGGGRSLASVWLGSASERPFSEQGTKADQQNAGNRRDFEAQRNLELRNVSDEIRKINEAGRIGPKRAARLEALTQRQSELIGQGADLTAFQPDQGRKPGFIEDIEATAGESQRARIEEGFGRSGGSLIDRLEAQADVVKKRIREEIQNDILGGKYLDPNDFMVESAVELEGLQGREKLVRAAQLRDEGKAGFKQYAKETFGKDRERRQAYMAEVNDRLANLGAAGRLPGPGGAAQRPGGYSTVRPRGMNERRDPFLETDLDQTDSRTGRGYTARDVKRPVETSLDKERDVLRSKILNEFGDISDRIPLDIAGIKQDTDQARRRGQATQGQTGAARADVRRERLGREISVPGEVTKYVPFTPEEEQTKFGERYSALDSSVNQYRKMEMAQRAARGVIRRSGLGDEATLEQRNEFLQNLAQDDRIPAIVKQEVGDLLAQRNFGSVGEGIVKQSALERENYVTGDEMRERYHAGAPFTNAEMVSGNRTSSTESGGTFASDGVYRVHVMNWPENFGSMAAPGEAAPSGRTSRVRRKNLISDGAGGNGRRPPAPPVGPDDAEPGDASRNASEGLPRIRLQMVPRTAHSEEERRLLRTQSRIQGPTLSELMPVGGEAERDIRRAAAAAGVNTRFQMAPRTAHSEEERRATPVPGRMFGPFLSDLAPLQVADPQQSIRNAATIAGIGTRIQMAPVERQSAQGRAIEAYEKRRERAQSQLGQVDYRISRLTAPLPKEVVQARVESANAAQRQQSRSIGTSIVSFFESLNPYRQQAQAARFRLNERTMVLDTLSNDKIGAISQKAVARAELKDVVKEMRTLRSAGVSNEMMPTGLLQRRLAAREEYRTASQSIRKFETAITAVTGEVASLSKEAGGLGSALSTLATGAVGGIAGGVVTMGVSAAAQGLINVGGAALGPTIERGTGNTATTARVQQGLGQAVIQSGGYTNAAVAGQIAATGLSGATATQLSPTLQARALGVAAGQQTTAQLDLIRTDARINAENQGYGGYDKSLFSTTGGFMGTPLFGQASVSEQLYNDMAPLLKPKPEQTGPDALGSALSVIASGIGGRGAGSAVKAGIAVSQGLDAQKYKGAENTFDNFIDTVNKSDDGLTAYAASSLKGTKANEDLAKSAEKFNNKGMAELIRATGMTVEGFEGDPDKQYAALMQQYAQNSVKMPASFLLQAMQPQLQAQEYGRLAQLQVQTQTTIPQQFGMQQAFSPTVAPGYSPTAAIEALAAGGLGLDRGRLSEIRGAAGRVTRQATAGQDAAKVTASMNLPAGAAKTFADELDRAKSIGGQIANLRMETGVSQAALSASQFTESLRQAKIAAQDARGLAGMKPNAAYNEPTAKGNLGTLQLSDFKLGQQSARLGQALTQRQINFQKAMAGFSAPGLTPEERAARIKQAKIEADYAQKQLNISKQLTTNQAKEFTITSARNVTVTAKQVELMGQSQATAVEASTNNTLIELLTAELQQPMQTVEAGYTTALGRINDEISAMAGVIAQTSGEFKDVTKAMEDMIPSITTWANALGIDYTPKKETRHDPKGKAERHASGLLGMTRGTTSLGIAGEAGTEAVAILKNPRPFAGGGGSHVTVNITGNQIGNRETADYLVNRVVAELGRKAAILGLR